MSDSDDAQRGALERALYSIIQDILGNNASGVAAGGVSTLGGAASSTLPDPATATAAAAAAASEISLAKPQSVFRWLKDAKKNIAPHADKVPLPIVQGLAKTVFPPAGAVVPVIRYLQTPPSAKHKNGGGGGALEVGLAPAATATASPPQIYIIPIVQPPPPPKPKRKGSAEVRMVMGAARELGRLVRSHPVLALLVGYLLWRARGVPGRAVRAVDRVVNAAWVVLWGWVERRTRARRAWAARKVGEVREKLTGYKPQADPGAGATTTLAEPEPVEGKIQLDIGDAAWVIITALIALYVGYNRKKIWKKPS